MNKLQLNTINVVKEFEFDTMRIFTYTYSAKVSKNELHTPNAAKIIIEGNGIISSFVLLQPVINVNNNGDASISTSSNFKQATSIEKYNLDKKSKSDIKREVKILKSKLELGIDIKELIKMNYSEAWYEAIILENRVENEYKGGGF